MEALQRKYFVLSKVFTVCPYLRLFFIAYLALSSTIYHQPEVNHQVDPKCCPLRELKGFRIAILGRIACVVST